MQLLFLLLALVFSQPIGKPGYINVNSEQHGNLFYWIFRSENWQTDPVVLWVSGGPGCSGALALFYENGPYTINQNLTLNNNPYSWTKFATVIYIDQPVGTGYSYAKTNYVHDEEAVARDMKVFFQKFFQTNPEYSKQDFYISGESYGGKYVPTMGKVILQLNKENPHSPIHLKGVSVGNGDVAPYYQIESQGQVAYAAGLINKDVYHKVQQTTHNCKELIHTGNWSGASDVCGSVIIDILRAAGNINPMNYKLHCKIQDCFVYDNITRYLNQPALKASLGVPSNVNWETCAYDPSTFSFTDKDLMDSYTWAVADLLEAGIRYVAYYGDLDLVCPYPGGLAWMDHTEWSGQRNFKLAPFHDWKMEGKVVGRVKKFKNFHFVRVHDAGHMTPHDQPEVSLFLFEQFLKNKL